MAAVRASTSVIRILRAAIALQCTHKHLLAGLSSSPSQPAFLQSVLAFPLWESLVRGIFIPADSCTRCSQMLYGCSVDPDTVSAARFSILPDLLSSPLCPEERLFDRLNFLTP